MDAKFDTVCENSSTASDRLDVWVITDIIYISSFLFVLFWKVSCLEFGKKEKIKQKTHTPKNPSLYYSRCCEYWEFHHITFFFFFITVGSSIHILTAIMTMRSFPRLDLNEWDGWQMLKTQNGGRDSLNQWRARVMIQAVINSLNQLDWTISEKMSANILCTWINDCRIAWRWPLHRLVPSVNAC